MSHANASPDPDRSAAPGPARRRQGLDRCAGPPSGGTARSPPRDGGPTATGEQGRAGDGATGPRARTRCPHQTPTATRAPDRGAAGLTPLGAGPDRLPARAWQPSTVHKVLRRYGCPRLAWTDPATGARIKWPPSAARHYATCTTRPATWSTSTSRSSAGSPTAAAGGSTAAARPTQAGTRQSTCRRTAATRLRLHPPRRRRPLPAGLLRDPRRRAQGDRRRRSGAAPTPSSPPTAITVQRVLTDNGSCYRSKLLAKTLAAARSSTSGPGPTGPRPTARSNGSTAPCSRNGPTPASTAQKPNASPPTPTGSTPTITTAATPHSRASHPADLVPNLRGQNT